MMAALFVSQSLFSASTIASFTLMPIISAKLGGGDSVAGVPATVTLLGRALAAYPAGWLMDRVGRRPGLSLGYLSVTLGGFLSALSISPWGSFLVFCLARDVA
jgi:MFS family permease